MITDAYLMRRLAYELRTEVGGSKVQDAGVLPDGRIAIVLWSRGVARSLCVDAFGSPPLVTLEPEEPAISVEPHFVRALGKALRGTVVTDVRARRDDRVLRATFGARNRFGVGEQWDLFIELIPRFGNAVLVKNDTVVAALKEFSLANNPVRPIAAGQTYSAPPQRPVESAPPTVRRGRTAEESADAGRFLQSDDALTVVPYVYRRDGRIVQVHLLPLLGLEDVRVAREGSVLEAFGEYARARSVWREDGLARRRAAVERRLLRRAASLRGELADLSRQRSAASQRDLLRADGEAIYAQLHAVPEDARDEHKARAAALFARYKKLGASLPHLDERERHVDRELAAVEELRWEATRTSGADFDDVERTVDALAQHGRGGRSSGPAPAAARRKRAPLEFTGPGGSRIFVGRSPSENADLTFRVARPEDLWFHARGAPGAHVILKRDDRATPPDADLAFAASVAAAYSKAKSSAKVSVDYTQRKYVRKQPGAAAGLVWYTQAHTLTVTPHADS